jgi:hypothetical protein
MAGRIMIERDIKRIAINDAVCTVITSSPSFEKNIN